MVRTSGNPDSRTMSHRDYVKYSARRVRATEEGARINRLTHRNKSANKYFEQSVIEMEYPKYISKEEWTKVRGYHTTTGKKLNEYELGKLLGWDKDV